MGKRVHVPIRMCIGCGNRKRKEELTRFTQVRNGAIIANNGKNSKGRGVYLCPDQKCIELAQKKKNIILFHGIDGSSRGLGIAIAKWKRK